MTNRLILTGENSGIGFDRPWIQHTKESEDSLS